MSFSCGHDRDQDGQEVPKCPDGNNHDAEEDEKSPSGANKQKEEDEVETMSLAWCTPATDILPLTIIEEMEEMFFRLGFSQTVAMTLVHDQGIVSTWILAHLSDNDIATICDVIRRPGGLVSGKM